MNKIFRIITAVGATLIIQNTAFADYQVAQHHPKFKNYAYTKFGISCTQYRKFKEIHNTYLKKSPKIAPMFHLGIGRKFAKSIRGEFNLQYSRLLYKAQNAEVSLKQKMNLYGAMANIYYDLLPNKIISPYITGGVGVGINDVKNLDISDPAQVKGKQTTNFIWDAGVGFRTDMIRRFTLDLGYRYAYLGKACIKTGQINSAVGATPLIGGTQKIYGHQFLAAVSYNF